jgi:hypothetical protein
LWKLGVDILLMCSIIAFVVRVLRNPSNPRGLRQLGELDGSIRGLIKEAENAGKSLNDQLIRRQDGLEKLLFDFESCEKRIIRLQSRAEETRGAVEVAMSKVQRGLDALNAALTRFQTKEAQVRLAAVEQQPMVQTVVAQPAPVIHREPVAPDQKIEVRGEAPHAPNVQPPVAAQPVFTPAVQPPVLPEQPVAQAVQQQPVPPFSGMAQPLAPVAPLASQIERETIPRRASPVTPEILSMAQSLLQQGATPETVSAKTGLSRDQVRLLIALDARKRSLKAGLGQQIIDPRLGVLGSQRKTTAT